MSEASTDDLTEAQRACLRLVLSHHNSKEIAGIVGVSPSAVDKRIERAIQVLGANSRFDAARRLAAIERGGAYDRLPSEAIDVPHTPADRQLTAQGGPWGLVRRLVGLSPSDGNAGTLRNPLTRLQRLLLVLGLVLGIAVASLVLVDIAATLTKLIRPMR